MQKHGKLIFIIFSIAVLYLLVIAAATDMVNSGTVLSDMEKIRFSVRGTIPLTGELVVPEVKGTVSLTQLATLQCKYFNEKEFMNSVIAVRQNQSGNRPVIQDKNTVTLPERTVPLSADGQNVVEVSTNQNLGGIEPRSILAGYALQMAIKSNSAAGGIVPHHLLAGKMIAEFFQTLSYDNPEIVVVIAPNHRRIGINGLHTSTQNWATAFGVLEADSILTGKLINELGASQNTALMEEEHSISSLVPYIKYYLPEAKIVPVLLHGNYSPKESIELGKLLAEALSDKTRAAIIASVDFSHYLDADTADKMDEITLAAIKSGDIPAISAMGNDNLDSPPSIMALLTSMEELGTAVPEVLSHGNSSDITGSGADYTTSYYTMLFKR